MTLTLPYSGCLFPVAVIVCLLLSYISRCYYILKYRNLPPGPYWSCLPLIGYFPFFDENNFYKTYQELAKKYGNIFGFYVGSRYVVFLGDFPVVKSAFNKEEFLNRPEGMMELTDGHQSIVVSNGTDWKDQRKVWATCLRQLVVGKRDFENFVLSEISKVCSSLRSTRGTKVNLNVLVEQPIHNVIFNLTYGKRFEPGHPLLRLLSKYNEAIQVRLMNQRFRMMFPFLGYLRKLAPDVRNAQKIVDEMDDIIRKEIEDHAATLNPKEPRDLIDYMLLQTDKPGAACKFDIPTMLGNAKTSLAAGSETTRNTVVWFLLFMAKHQEIQRRVQAEVDQVLDPEREPCFEDRLQLPFTEATILETMRFGNLLHLNVPRMADRDVRFCDFDIPKGSIILQCMTAHFRNPEYFDLPDEFDPKRFLTKDGKVHVPEYFMPFSYGRRNCIGERSAATMVFLFCTRLIQRFNIVPPDGFVNLQVLPQFTNSALHPYACLEPRI